MSLHSGPMVDWMPNAVALQLGPFSLYWYGIAYAVGIAAAYWAVTRQARIFGLDTRVIGNGIIVIAVAALIGGRLYHVIDQWQLYANDPLKIILPPYSGLGVFGGVVTGLIAFIVLVRRWHLSGWPWADVVATGVFAMQAAGRVGNFFNQELYGPPTDLPWGISIDCAHRVVEYPCATFPVDSTHFQPLFLYESISGLLGLVTLLWLASRPRPWLRVGDLVGIMFVWIGGVRFFVEFLRINNWRLADIPTAQLFGVAFVLLGIGIMVLRRAQGAPTLAPAAAPFVAPGVDTDAAEDGEDDDDPFAEYDAARRDRST